MESYQNSKLSLGEQLYIWIFIYIVKTKFYVENHIPNWDAAYCFGFLQWLNLVVIWHSFLLIFDITLTYSKWVEVGVGMCLMGVNVLLYSRKFDQIMARHNALTQQERSRGRMRMWIYVLITLVSTIGLFTFIELTRENRKQNLFMTKHESKFLNYIFLIYPNNPVASFAKGNTGRT